MKIIESCHEMEQAWNIFLIRTCIFNLHCQISSPNPKMEKYVIVPREIVVNYLVPPTCSFIRNLRSTLLDLMAKDHITQD